MAFQFPKIDLADAKTRILLIIGGVIGFVVIVYVGRHLFTSAAPSSGPSHVAKAPGNLQSVPGGQLTPEYYRALVQANEQAAKQAQMSGGSAVPTLLNEPGAQPSFQQPSSSSNCTVVCPTEENVDVESEINDLVKSGKLSAEEGKKLIELVKKNVAFNYFSARLGQLVAQGKLTPDQARKITEDYKKQHQNNLLKESGVQMDSLIKAGQLPLDVALELLDSQKKGASLGEYASQLSEIESDGKLTPQPALLLLGQYTQQQAKEGASVRSGQVEQMAVSGQIKTDVAKELEDYQQRSVSLKEYEEELQHLVRQGKLLPEQSQRLLVQYRLQVLPGVADELVDFMKRNAPVSDYEAKLQKLTQDGKMMPVLSQQLLDQYRQVKMAGGKEGALNDLIRQAEKENEDAVQKMAETGKISSETAQKLLELQHQKIPVDEYKKYLDDLVRQGKLDLADAQRLLLNYMQQKGAGVQDLAASGRITSETANKLMELQHANVPAEEYKRQLDLLAKEGKIFPSDAARLLSNYEQIKGAGVQDFLSSGKISPDTAQKLMDLQRNTASADEYKRQLDKLVKEGKISSEDAQKLLSNYQQMKGGVGVQELAATHRLSNEEEQHLLDLQHANVPVDQYKHELDQLVKEGKTSPQEASALLMKYQKLYGVREEADRLSSMRGNNVSAADYAAELQRAVTAGTISADKAGRLLKEYQTSRAEQASVRPIAALPNVKGASEFAALQKRIQAAGPPEVTPIKPFTAPQVPVVTGTAPMTQLSAAQAKAQALAEQQEQQRLQALMGAMSQQAGQLIGSWQPPTMSGQVGVTEKETKSAAGASKDGEKGAEKNSKTAASNGPPQSPIIKAGTIIYAILDTAVNSDFPDSPVLATIVSGKYKGAKLLGKLAITQGQDRVSLTFKLMNMEDWSTGKTINAYAIDPDTARTALASNVNYHYFMRYGALFASSFITGYANAISSSGATTSLSVTGSTTTNPVLSPSSKFIAGLGQVGQNLGKAVQDYTKTPPTVVIDPGVSLGILFMSDVTG